MGIETLPGTQLGAMRIKANLPRACALNPQHAGMCASDSEGNGSVPVLIMLQASPGR